MKKKLLAGLATGLLMLGMSGVASANLITFDDYSPMQSQASDPLLTHGFQFAGGMPGVWNTQSSPAGAYNGTPYLIFFQPMTFSQTGGGSFVLDSLELGLSWFHGGQGTAVVTSNLVGGGTTTNYLSLDSNFQTFSPGINVTSVTISSMGSSGYFAMDNLNVTPTPEPATMLLLGSGLAGLIGGRRKKTNQ